MGRPLDSRNFGNPTGAGNQFTFSSCWIPGESAANATSWIVRQIGASRFVAHNSATGNEGIVQLQAGTAAAAGQAQIIVTPAISGEGAVVSPRLGVNSATVQAGGTGYAVNDVLTISSGATLTVSTVSGGVITAVAVTTPGSFSSLPANPVSVTGGTGTGAKFTLNYKLVSFVVSAGGSGYTSATLVVSGSGTGTLTLSGGAVTAASVGTPGVYTAMPSATVEGISGSGAVVSPRLGVITATVAAGGTGYAVNDVLTLSSGATLKVTTAGGGVISAVLITAAGSFTSLPSNPVAATGGTGTGATFNLSYKLVSFVVTNGGTGYSNGATLTVTGNGAGTVTVSNGVVTAATVATPGTYTSVPTVGVTGVAATDAVSSLWFNRVNTFNKAQYIWNRDGSLHVDARHAGLPLT